MASDVELVAAALSGEPADFAPIVDRYRDAVFGIALARVRNFHDAEDIAQTVFLEAYQRLPDIRDPTRLGPWLRTIAINRSIDSLRLKKDLVDADRLDEEGVNSITHGEQRDEDVRAAVLSAIGKLNKRQRETVALFYINGYSVEEVADMQGSPVGTVKSRLHDSRKRLKEEMMDTVQDILRSGRPNRQEFGKRVFSLLDQHNRGGHWAHKQYVDVASDLKQLCSDNADGILDGLARSLESPHSPTRTVAAVMLVEFAASKEIATGPMAEQIRALLRKTLEDPSKKVRSRAIWGVERLAVGDHLKRAEFAPCVVPMLDDRSVRVRQAAARLLRKWPAEVPLEAAARALARSDPARLPRQHAHALESELRQLTNAVIAAGESARSET